MIILDNAASWTSDFMISIDIFDSLYLTKSSIGILKSIDLTVINPDWNRHKIKSIGTRITKYEFFLIETLIITLKKSHL